MSYTFSMHSWRISLYILYKCAIININIYVHRQTWARLLSERVREKQWVYANLISPIVQGRCTDEEYNRDLNILFIKLHLLDPTTVMSTYDYLRKGGFSKISIPFSTQVSYIVYCQTFNNVRYTKYNAICCINVFIINHIVIFFK